jgi:UDPglucose 6-dehydrogenase
MEERMKLKIGIVGYGFVGQAVDYAFSSGDVEKFYVDPKLDTSLDDLIDWNPHVSFICAPTPMSDDGFVYAYIVEDALLKILEHTKGGVVIKSTITPDIVDRIFQSIYDDDVKRITINPEFLTEKNAKADFVMADYHIIGGDLWLCERVADIYRQYSMCMTNDFYFMSATDASFVKYASNSFLAMKVTFFNQLHDSVTKFGSNWSLVSSTLARDKRIGRSHTVVPGYDNKRGYGGACFPKDTLAFIKFDNDLTLLEKCVIINNEYRKQYELDDREKINNVNYE